MSDSNSLIISLPEGLSIDFIFVEGGNYTMGNKLAYPKELTNVVQVPSFYISKYLVTKSIWTNVSKDYRYLHYPLEGNRPAERVSFDEVKGFIEKLNTLPGIIPINMNKFRLPSEAEWEYAARGGTHIDPNPKYKYINRYSGCYKIEDAGWFIGNSNNETHDVGLKMPNVLGLYDTTGNVYEWCEDDWHDNFIGSPTNGSAWIDTPIRSNSRVVRGGCFKSDESNCHQWHRKTIDIIYSPNNVGFRLVLPFI